jgi:hypothetical protein
MHVQYVCVSICVSVNILQVCCVYVSIHVCTCVHVCVEVVHVRVCVLGIYATSTCMCLSISMPQVRVHAGCRGMCVYVPQVHIYLYRVPDTLQPLDVLPSQ